VTQDDSDVLAHFVQVVKQIATSSWLKQKCQLGGQRGDDAVFPSLESFVFAAVYIRQLMAKRDSLLKDACETYCRCTSSSVKAMWVNAERDGAMKHWKNNGPFVLGNSTEHLFEMMVYGAHLLHTRRATYAHLLDEFHQVLKEHSRETVIFCLHTSLRLLFNHLSSISAAIYQDYSHWVNNDLSPRPNVMWHESLFASTAST
jgi:hypothetical protein